MPPPPQPSPAPRSCDECRTRKTRCDRGSPCSHCRAMNLTCRTTTQRSKEHKDRIHVTKQYEMKMDRMDSRLANIECLLQAMSSRPAAEAGLDIPPADGVDRDNSSDTECVPGDVGLHAESAAAQEAVTRTVNRDFAIQQDTHLGRVLDSLRRIVAGVQHDADSEHFVDFALSRPLVTLAPTWTEIQPVLERYVASKPSKFHWAIPELKQQFYHKCLAMYQHGKEGSPMDKLFVYSTLSNVCAEFSTIGKGGTAEHYHRLSRTFASMLLTVLRTVPLLSPASLSAAEALLSAATTITGLCKPSLAWSLLQSASRMCQALRYNRLPSGDPTSDPLLNRKLMVFWSTYIMDRTTSLRLGRAPAITDDDIDDQLFTLCLNNTSLPPMLLFWIKCARVQGDVSSKLYGPRSQHLSPTERAQVAEGFALELEDVHAHKNASCDSESSFDTEPAYAAAELLLDGQNMVHYSTATMALSTIPLDHPRRFLALDAARKSLRSAMRIRESHKTTINDYAWVVYCHWMLLHSPVTPFMTIFGHVVGHPLLSGDDLSLLQGFVSTLQPALHLSEEVEKFHRLCSIFLQVAEAYVQAKTSQTAQESSTSTMSSMVGELEECLNPLGIFAPHTIPSQIQGLEPGLEQTQMQSRVPSCVDWFSVPMSLNELLEQDFLGDGFGGLENVPLSQ